jgi:hypothetical protein
MGVGMQGRDRNRYRDKKGGDRGKGRTSRIEILRRGTEKY